MTNADTTTEPVEAEIPDFSMDPVLAPVVRGWLKEKVDRGVKQVWASSVLAQIDGELPAIGDTLVGTAEAAEMLGVEKPRLAKWRRSGVVPPPLAELRMGPVWLRSQIEASVEGANARRRGGGPVSPYRGPPT